MENVGQTITGQSNIGPITAVVFDVGRVIVQWDLRHLMAKVVTDPAECDWVLDHVITERWHFQHDAGRALDVMVAERKALFPKYAEAIDAYAARFIETIPGRVPGTVDIIQQLHRQNMPLFAITNFGAEFWEQFAPTEPVLELFADILVSGQEKLVKPDPAIFRHAAQRFGHDPEAMLFIDDNLANIEGAAALGWQVHHFTGAAELEADLEARGSLTR